MPKETETPEVKPEVTPTVVTETPVAKPQPEMLTSSPAKKGKTRIMESDGLIMESDAPEFAVNTVVLFEGKQWTVAGFNPSDRSYAIRNNELLTKVAESDLRGTTL